MRKFVTPKNVDKKVENILMKIKPCSKNVQKAFMAFILYLFK